MSQPPPESFRIWIDTGGTFTDAIAAAPDGTRRRIKLLSSGVLRGQARAGGEIEAPWIGALPNWAGFRLHLVGGQADAAGSPAEEALGQLTPGQTFELRCDRDAPIVAAHLLTGTPLDRPLPACEVRLATTLGTNALLESAGSKPVLFVTRGFGDLLRIGDQRRPDLFAQRVVKAAPLHGLSIEVPERLDAGGNVLLPIDLQATRAAAEACLRSGIDSAAIALLHAYRNPEHERQLRDALMEWGFRYVSCSHEMARGIRIVPRATTATVDAYLAPVVREFLDRVQRDIRGRLFVMTSAGGLLGAESYRPKDSLLSGPAGGVVGAASAALRNGASRGLGLDMGGTSTDVSRWDRGFDYVYEHRVGNAHLLSPAIGIETVAAGGGSICWFDGRRLRVGPKSAGSNPGPACYGAGGPLTLTDVNLLLGRIEPSGFGVPLDPAAAERRWSELRSRIAEREPLRDDGESLLQGFLDVADERMADAIREVSLRRGYSPSGYPLVAFGGAAGQHACSIAARLGIRSILFPPDAALLSAVGLGRAERERFAERQILQPLERVAAELPGTIANLEAEALSLLRADSVGEEQGAVRSRSLHLRFAGQDHSLELAWPQAGAELDLPATIREFEVRHRERFGHVPEGRPVELESVRVVAAIPSEPVPAAEATAEAGFPDADGTRTVYLADGSRTVPTFRRERLQSGDRIDGPAIVVEPHTSLWVEPGWHALRTAGGALELTRASQPTAADGNAAVGVDTDVDEREGPLSPVVRRELFTQRFNAIVREMGAILERTAVSTNVKERLDFSCALLDAQGELVVNAPHVPVHLGALGLCVREVLRALPAPAAGDHIVTNHPGFGGSHLPDVTVISPVHTKSAPPQLLGYVASRAHHAEIGGTRPGSMPPNATHLVEEGVVLPPSWIVRNGVEHWDALERALSEAPYPSRNVADNLTDLRAAVAANHRGREALARLAEREGAPAIGEAMESLAAHAEERISTMLAARAGGSAGGSAEAEERLDDGTPLRVRFRWAAGKARFDFRGSGPTHPGNLNATPAIVRSAVIYVLRLLVGEALPLNEGLLRPIEIRLPRGILNPDFSGAAERLPAVVGGNTETSQRLVDTLLKALGLAACSQGTMNNVIFGTESWAHYETVGGGSGATPDGPGASGVHTHMTNTRITDPEVLEHRYPVRLERFALRRDSGGAGLHRGGDGLIREYHFLEPVSLSLVTQHRVERPYGIAGGGCGERGRQRISTRDTPLDSVDGCEMRPGDRLLLETPGGGGCGVGEPAE